MRATFLSLRESMSRLSVSIRVLRIAQGQADLAAAKHYAKCLTVIPT